MATYWRGATEDAAMQEEHGFIWRVGHGHHDGHHLVDWIDYSSEQKLLLRFARGHEPA